MSEHAIGVLLGLAAALAFESSYLVLATQARRVALGARPNASFLGRLAHRPWWIAAMALNGVAFVLELAALRRVSLVVVQPLLGVGLIGLVIATRFVLGESVGPRQYVGVVLVATGAALVIVGAPKGTSTLPLNAATVTVVAVLAAALALPQVGPLDWPWSFVAAAAAGDTLVALSTTSVAHNWPDRVGAVAAGVAAVAVCGLMSVTSESAALQRLPASRVAPIVSGVQTTLPALLVAVLGAPRWSTALAGGAVLAVGGVTVGAGAFLLGSTRGGRATAGPG